MGNFDEERNENELPFHEQLKSLDWIDLLAKYRQETAGNNKLKAIKCLREMMTRAMRFNGGQWFPGLKESKEIQDQIQFLIENSPSTNRMKKDLDYFKQYYRKYHDIREIMVDLSEAYRLAVEVNERNSSSNLKEVIKLLEAEMLALTFNYFEC